VKQERFIEEYLVDLNATQAAIRAGYSRRTAAQIGYENLKKPQITEAIRRAMAERSTRTEVTAAQVVGELSRIAFSRLTDVASWDPDTGVSFTPSVELGPDAAASVKKVKDNTRGASSPNLDALTGVNLEVEQYDKLAALHLLARHLGMLENTDPTPPILINNIMTLKGSGE
jgi:phage terminase small subunit